MHDEVELGFEVDEVPLRALLTAAEEFGALVREVARSYAGDIPHRWMVRVEKGSIKLPSRPVATEPGQAADRLLRVPHLVAEGLALLEARAERPAFFSDSALEHVEGLARVAKDELPMGVRNGGAHAPLSARLVANTKAILGDLEKSIGSVEGRLEALNLHRSEPHFWVYDLLTGRRVTCLLTDEVTVDDLRPALGHRVAVRGEKRSRREGGTVEIRALELRDLDAPGIAGVEEVRGMLDGYEKLPGWGETT